MTDISKATCEAVVQRLHADETRAQKVFDFVVMQRDKNHGTPAFSDINNIKHAISGRDPVIEPAADLITALRAALDERERCGVYVASKVKHAEWAALADDPEAKAIVENWLSGFGEPPLHLSQLQKDWLVGSIAAANQKAKRALAAFIDTGEESDAE